MVLKMIKAKELDKLYKKYDALKEQEAKSKGGIDATLSQLKKLNINSIEEAKNVVRNKKIEMEKNSQKLDKLLIKANKLLKN